MKSWWLLCNRSAPGHSEDCGLQCKTQPSSFFHPYSWMEKKIFQWWDELRWEGVHQLCSYCWYNSLSLSDKALLRMFVTKRFIRNYLLFCFDTLTQPICATGGSKVWPWLKPWSTRPEKAEVGPGWPKPSILPPLDTDQYRLLDKLNTLQEYYKQIWAILGYSTTTKPAFILCLDMDNLRNIFQHKVALTIFCKFIS